MVINSPVGTGLLSTGTTGGSATTHFEKIYEGIVEDVILDSTHDEYSLENGKNVGTIKVRIFEDTLYSDSTLLDYAHPMNRSMFEIPLIGELVILYKIKNTFFYMKKVSWSHRLSEDAYLSSKNELDNRSANILNLRMVNGEENTSALDNFGNYFIPDSRVRQLQHFEGDLILQGRMGNSIRFGSSKMDPRSEGLAPNIILRAGQAKGVEENSASMDTIFGVILEDINHDASSIWMTSDQRLPFEPTTLQAGSFYRSIFNPINIFDKASITVNSDRVVLNSKKTHIMLFSNEEIYLNSVKRAAIDTDDSIFLTANIDINNMSSRDINSVADKDITLKAGDDVLILGRTKISLTSNKIHIGGIENTAEPLVGGTSLALFLGRLIQVLMGTGIVAPQIPYQALGLPGPILTVIPPLPTPGPANFAHVITPMGPGLLNPAILTGLLTLYTELALPNPGARLPLPFTGAVFSSYDNFVALANQDPSLGIELNEFREGAQIETENNDWNLSDRYYRVV
jgi:hypothetical protein